MKFNYILMSIFIFKVNTHSAVSCTDLRGVKCDGYPRYYHFNHLDEKLPSSDDVDTFYASRDRETLLQPGIKKICPEMTLPEYNDEFPMAEAYAGETLIVQHPPRGHSNQPSSHVFIFMNQIPNIFPGNKQPDPKDFKLVAEYPFEHCYGLEKEISWARCTGPLKIPENTQPGVYTFWWRWDLNGIPYTDCFEVNVKKYVQFQF